MQKKKNDNHQNITTIFHDLKISYAKTFGEKFPLNDRKMEDNLVGIAREVKGGKKFKWYFDINGNKQIQLI